MVTIFYAYFIENGLSDAFQEYGFYCRKSFLLYNKKIVLTQRIRHGLRDFIFILYPKKSLMKRSSNIEMFIVQRYRCIQLGALGLGLLNRSNLFYLWSVLKFAYRRKICLQICFLCLDVALEVRTDPDCQLSCKYGSSSK